MVDRGDRGDRALERAGHGRAGVLVYTVNTMKPPSALAHSGFLPGVRRPALTT